MPGSGLAAAPKLGRGSGGGAGTLSLLLLVGAGLFLTEPGKLGSRGCRFRRRHLLAIRFESRQVGFTTGPACARFYSDLLAQLDCAARRLSAGVSAQARWTEGGATPFTRPDTPLLRTRKSSSPADAITPGYWKPWAPLSWPAAALFWRADSQNAAKVAILNEFRSAERTSPHHPIGKRIGMGLDGPADIEWWAVVKDMKYRGLRSATERVVYTPLAQDAPRVSRWR